MNYGELDSKWIPVTREEFNNALDRIFYYRRAHWSDATIYIDWLGLPFGGIRILRNEPDKYYIDKGLYEGAHSV